MTEGKKKSLENLKKRKPFVKGDERINRKGANKGSRWKKTLLEELMTVDLSTSEVDAFNSIKQRFPSFFNGSHDQNFQLFLEVKQVSLSFSKDERVAQTAIEKIKDRIEGKAISREAQVDTEGKDLISNSLIIRVDKVEDAKIVSSESEIEDVGHEYLEDGNKEV